MPSNSNYYEDNYFLPVAFIIENIIYYRVIIFTTIVLYLLGRSFRQFQLTRAVFIFPVYLVVLLSTPVSLDDFERDAFEASFDFICLTVPVIIFYISLVGYTGKNNNLIEDQTLDIKPAPNNDKIEVNHSKVKLYKTIFSLSNISIKFDERSVFWFVPSIVLLIGIFDMPIEYYTLLRLVVSGCCVYFLIAFINQETKTRSIIFGFFAVLYNPIFPIYLYEKSIWITLNIITIIVLTYYGFTFVKGNADSKEMSLMIPTKLLKIQNLFKNRTFQNFIIFISIIFLITFLRLFFDGRIL